MVFNREYHSETLKLKRGRKGFKAINIIREIEYMKDNNLWMSGRWKAYEKKLILLSLFSTLFDCTSTVSGNDINCQKDGSISALYSTIKLTKDYT